MVSYWHVYFATAEWALERYRVRLELGQVDSVCGKASVTN